MEKGILKIRMPDGSFYPLPTVKGKDADIEGANRAIEAANTAAQNAQDKINELEQIQDDLQSLSDKVEQQGNFAEEQANRITVLKLDDLTDVAITDPQVGQSLVWDGINFVNANQEGSGITEEESAWLGYGAELSNGGESLPEGINNNTTEITTLKEEFAKRFPFRITSFSGGKLAEKGTTTSASLSWAYDGIPTSQELKQGSVVIPTVITDRSKTVTDITTNTTFTLTANGVSSSQSISFYNAKYVGNVTSAPATEAEVKSLTKLGITSSRSYTWNGNLNLNKVSYCYPKAFGALTSIKDGSGFEYLSSFELTEFTVNSETYYIYTSPTATSQGFRYVFA